MREWNRNLVHPQQWSTPNPLRAVLSWVPNLPKSDIGGKIHLSLSRCVLSLVSLVLVVTDVPRTGLGVQSISEYFPNKVAPDTAIRFGPYAYPVVRITCAQQDQSSDTGICQGLSGPANISSVPVWPYAFDTTSIGLRSAAELLNLTPHFPDFLFNRGNDPRRDNPNAQLSLNGAFKMLESITENSHQFLNHPHQTKSIPSISITTQYKFSDRLSDYLLQWFRSRKLTRKFLLQAYKKRSKSTSETIWMCGQRTESRGRQSNRPNLCDHHVRWMTPHPDDPTHSPVPIWNHVALRLQAFQEQYQELWLDVTLLSMQELVSTTSLTRATVFNLEAADLVMITRGKSCSFQHPHINCTTVFIDDYRYERYLLTSNIGDMYRVTSTLRGTAQFYMWIRILLLFYTSYVAQPESLERKEKIRNMFATIFKIPFQVIVYGSFIPVMLYVLAFLIDANFIEAYLEVYWATIRGFVGKFDLIGFIRVAAVQMRNVWLLALFTKFYTLTQARGSRWRANQTVFGLRGLAISCASFLSIFGQYRSLSFRKCDILNTRFTGEFDTSRSNQIRLLSSPVQNVTIIGDSMVTTFAVVVFILVMSTVIYLVGWKRLEGGVLFVPTMMVPHAAEVLWPLTTLGTCFRANLTDKECTPRSYAPVGLFIPTTRIETPTQSLIVVSSRRYWSRGIRNGTASRKLRSNANQAWDSVAIQSLKKLMNISMMSDPWTFCQLFVFGQRLYIYQSQDFPPNERNPTPLMNIFAQSPTALLREIGFGQDEYQLITDIKSSDLSIAIVLCCA